MRSIIKAILFLIFKAKLKTVKIDRDEILFIRVDESSYDELINLKKYIQLYIDDMIFFVHDDSIDIRTISLSTDDVIIVEIDKGAYLYEKSIDKYDEMCDRIKKMFLDSDIENRLICQPPNITYNKKERKLIIEELTNEK